jgi:hypothetical protein
MRVARRRSRVSRWRLFVFHEIKNVTDVGYAARARTPHHSLSTVIRADARERDTMKNE